MSAFSWREINKCIVCKKTYPKIRLNSLLLFSFINTIRKKGRKIGIMEKKYTIDEKKVVDNTISV